MFFKRVQHGIMNGQEEYRGPNLIVEEHAAVQGLKDVCCQTQVDGQWTEFGLYVRNVQRASAGAGL